jgi:glyoxylase-like metal-dependent hydrolase (beta-lactamase superfamily II)
MPVSVTVGEATIIALSDTEQAYKAANVYPEATAAMLQPYRDLLTSDGSVLLNFGCYLIRADGRTVLVDTGWGPSFDGRLPAELQDAGVALDAIDVVVFTHLHGDHIGWNIDAAGGTPRPRFPKARYLAPEADWRHYSAQPEPSAMFREQMLPLEGLGVLDLVGGDHAISASVTTVSTPGHTPGHLSIAVTSGGEHGFILGDVALSPIDVQETAWKNSFDWDSDMARATRQRTLERLEQSGALVGASHLPKPGLGRFSRTDGRRIWQPCG